MQRKMVSIFVDSIMNMRLIDDALHRQKGQHRSEESCHNGRHLLYNSICHNKIVTSFVFDKSPHCNTCRLQSNGFQLQSDYASYSPDRSFDMRELNLLTFGIRYISIWNVICKRPSFDIWLVTTISSILSPCSGITWYAIITDASHYKERKQRSSIFKKCSNHIMNKKASKTHQLRPT